MCLVACMGRAHGQAACCVTAWSACPRIPLHVRASTGAPGLAARVAGAHLAAGGNRVSLRKEKGLALPAVDRLGLIREVGCGGGREPGKVGAGQACGLACAPQGRMGMRMRRLRVREPPVAARGWRLGTANSVLPCACTARSSSMRGRTSSCQPLHSSQVRRDDCRSGYALAAMWCVPCACRPPCATG